MRQAHLAPAADVHLEERAPGIGPRVRAMRILIADGQVLVRAGLRTVFETEADIAVVAEAADGAQALALAGETRPDVVLIDIGLDGVDTPELTRRIRADSDGGRPEVIVLAAQTDDERLFAVLRAGATGFLLKDTDAAGLVQAVRVVVDGDALLSPSLTRRLIAELAAHPDPKRPSPEQFEDLTAREREVVTLVAAGLSNKEIAERLVVSPATAKTHVSRALYKVRARDRAQLVALAYETGLVTPRDNGALDGGPASRVEFAAKVEELKSKFHRTSAGAPA